MATNAAGSEAPSFEEALAQLEAIVHDLEEGSIGLAEALARYEQGVGLLKQCYGLLERAERKIELLTGLDSSGEPITAALDDQVQSLEEKGRNRGRRRGAGGAKTRPGPADEGSESGVDAF